MSRSENGQPISDIDICVLAGGLGTRLGAVLPDLPKIMAPVARRPFLEHLLCWLRGQGAARVILGLGYRAAPVLAYLDAHCFSPLAIVPVVESCPLGTAGAVRFALPWLRSDPVMVLNGDTFVEADLTSFLASHRASRCGASILCVRSEDRSRYGGIEVDLASRVVRFQEKDVAAAPGWISAGVYLFGRAVLDRIGTIDCGSLERDILETMPPYSIHAYQTAGRFVDIGTPESLAQAAGILAATGPSGGCSL